MTVIVNGTPSTDEDDEGTGPLHATLASALLALNVAPESVNDVLWTSSVLPTESVCGSPTAENAVATAMRVSGRTAASLGMSIRHPEALGKTLRTRRLGELWSGAVQNPYLLLEDGEWMVENGASGEVAQVVAERTAARKLLDTSLAKGSVHAADVVRTLIRARDAHTLTDAYTGSDEMAEELTQRFLTDQDTSLRVAVLDLLGQKDPSSRDRLAARLLEEAEVVDAELLAWLKTSESFEAELLRALAFPENGVADSEFGKKLARRLDERAAWWALEVGDLADLAKETHTPARGVAMWRDYEPEPLRPRQLAEKLRNADAQRTQILALRAAGLTDEAIAPIILGGADGIDHDEMLDLVAGAGSTLIAGYLAGFHKRMPRQGDATELWNRIDADKREYACAALAEHPNLGEAPWTAELVLVAPKVLTRGFPAPLVWAAYRLLAERLEDDADAWEVAVALVSEWTGTLEELVYTSRTLVPEDRASRKGSWGNDTADISKVLFGKSDRQILDDEAENKS